MKTGQIFTPPGISRALLSALALVVLAAFTAPQMSQASTAANTVITNTVTVNYNNTDGVGQTPATDSVAVTINLVPTTPFLSAPDDDTTAYGTDATYTYFLTSNANGEDTYNLSATVGTQIGITGSSASVPVSLTLGGTTLAAAVALNDTTITVPYDGSNNADVNGIVPLEKIQIGGVIYTVAAAGISNNPATNLTTITLTSGITAATVTAAAIGDVIGEQGTFTLTVTPGPDPAVVDGATIVVTVEAEDSGATQTPASDDTTTTVTVPDATLSVTKLVAKDAATFNNTLGDLRAVPNDTLTYQITITNTSTLMNATSVVVTDPEPQFTTYVAGSARVTLTGATYALSTTIYDTNNAGDILASHPADDYDFGVTNTGEVTYSIGTMAPGDEVVLYYQVTIN